jgi:hypothetical protein
MALWTNLMSFGRRVATKSAQNTGGRQTGAGVYALTMTTSSLSWAVPES